jgi:hypothetical protein
MKLTLFVRSLRLFVTSFVRGFISVFSGGLGTALKKILK